MAFSNPAVTPSSGLTYVDALLWGSHWQDPAAGTRLAVWVAGAGGFDEAFDFGGTTVIANNAPEENDAFVNAFQSIADICNLTFLPAASQADADIIVGTVDDFDAQGALGIATPPGEDTGPLASQQGSVIINWEAYSTTDFSSLLPGGYDFVTYIHEVLHSLGLKHPHNVIGANGTFPGVPDGASFDDLGDFNLNQGIYTVMSYNDGWQDRPGGTLFDLGVYTYGYAATPMAFDIAAIQYLYGANTTFEAGNSNYTLPSVNAAGTFYSCLWDAGGTDALINNTTLHDSRGWRGQ